MRTKSNKELWWIVRILSGLIIAFSIYMFLGQTFGGKPRAEPMDVSSIIGLFFGGLGLIGLGLAWKWELAGGIISLVAFIVIGAMEPTLFITPLVYIYPGTAVLFIVLWAKNKKTSERKQIR